MYFFIHGGGAFQKITLMRGGGMQKKSEIGGGVIQFSNYTPPNPISPSYPIKNERSLTGTHGLKRRISTPRAKGVYVFKPVMGAWNERILQVSSRKENCLCFLSFLSKMLTEVYLVNSRISTSVYATKLFV